ncbi:MAG TPA: hypothetical protein VJI73_00250 [Candidatus Paceibacterota bacterium]
MRTIQERKQDKRSIIYHGWRRVLYSWPVLIILFILIVLMIKSTWRVYVNWDLSKDLAREANLEYLANQERTARIEEEVARLKTERGLEEELRRSFPIAKPGEEVVVILGDRPTSTNNR